MERDIGGHPTWVEDAGGEGTPVLLLHGGISDSRDLAPLGERLTADGYRVVAFDRRGHGRTADTDEPFHYDDMATEAIGVLEAVVGGPAHLIGWSDGGIVALRVAATRPDLATSLVLIGVNFHHEGLHPEAFTGDDGALDGLKDSYVAVSPHGAEHWDVHLGKALTLFTTEPTMTPADLAAIDVPALVLAGDDDLLTLTHTCELYESLPQSRLAIVPGTSHVLPLERPDLTGQLVTEFLASHAEPPATFLPIRRRPRPDATT